MEKYYNYRQEVVQSGYMSEVYGWMFLALMITAAMSIVTLGSPILATAAVRGFWVLGSVSR